MSAVIALRPSTLPAERPGAGWEQLPEQMRQIALTRGAIARRVVDRMAWQSQRAALRSVMCEIRAGMHTNAVRLLGEQPSEASLRRWSSALAAGGVEALAPSYTGRVRKDYGWEVRAQRLFAQPQRPAYSTVAYWLRQEGFDSATESRVRRYLKSLPSNKTETSRQRVGGHFYDQNIRPHVRRDVTVLNVGDVYEADGHTCDVYVQHPATGKHFRPELTTFIDVRAQKIVGWWLGEFENSIDVLYALSTAIRNHGHVPVMLHTDPGSGYVNKMLSDEATGFYARLDITPVTTIPGNARGKGLQEGWFRWFEERLGKRFPSFCGHCRTDDALSRLAMRIKRGEIPIPTFAQYLDAVRAYIETYNNTPKAALEGKTPNQLWEGLTINPLHLPLDVLMRPRREATVRSWEVRFENRFYRASELAQYERRKVVIEYDIHDDSRVWIRDAKGRLVCEALLVDKKPWAAENVLADRRQRSLRGQHKRLQAHADEASARAGRPITTAAMIDALDTPMHAEAPALAHDVLDAGHSLGLAPSKAKRAPRAVSPQAVEQLRSRMAEDAAEVPAETSAMRYARAKELERADTLSEDEARWLEIYQTSPEYSAFELISDHFQDEAGVDAPASGTTTSR